MNWLLHAMIVIIGAICAIMIRLGIALYRAGKLNEAAVDFQKMLALEPAFGEAHWTCPHNGLGTILEREGKTIFRLNTFSLPFFRPGPNTVTVSDGHQVF